jgi:hypothetical protein
MVADFFIPPQIKVILISCFMYVLETVMVIAGISQNILSIFNIQQI